MSRENVEVVERTLAEVMRTGEPEWELLDQAVEVHDHDIPDAGEYRGHQGFTRWLEDWGAAWEDFDMVPEEVVDGGERVALIVQMKATGKGSGVEVARQDGIVCTVREGKITRLDYFNSRAEALRAAGVAG
jgi:ketosteroid isomerase-like protein